MNTDFVSPYFVLPKLHKNAARMSFENYWKIRKIYKDIIGLEGIDHFSINIANPEKKISVFSYTPAILCNLLKSGLYRYNGAMSPTYYERLDFFSWDQCYDIRFAEVMKDQMQRRFKITFGFCLVRKMSGFYIVYIFATKGSKMRLIERLSDDRSPFFRMGDHCYDSLRNVYAQYADIYYPPKLKF